jgi:hypothetical protein
MCPKARKANTEQANTGLANTEQNAGQAACGTAVAQDTRIPGSIGASPTATDPPPVPVPSSPPVDCFA